MPPLPVFHSFDVILPALSFTNQLLKIVFCFHPSFILSSLPYCEHSFLISLKLSLVRVIVTS